VDIWTGHLYRPQYKDHDELGLLLGENVADLNKSKLYPDSYSSIPGYVMPYPCSSG
jgi:hypothetical protein